MTADDYGMTFSAQPSTLITPDDISYVPLAKRLKKFCCRKLTLGGMLARKFNVIISSAHGILTLTLHIAALLKLSGTLMISQDDDVK